MKNELKDSASVAEADGVLRSLGLRCVELSETKRRSCYSMAVSVVRDDGDDVSTDSLDEAYQVLYPFFQVTRKERDIELSVSSPGLERKIKDAYEFGFFKGRRALVCAGVQAEGVIVGSDDRSVTLRTSRGEEKFDFEGITKAVLVWRISDEKEQG